MSFFTTSRHPHFFPSFYLKRCVVGHGEILKFKGVLTSKTSAENLCYKRQIEVCACSEFLLQHQSWLSFCECLLRKGAVSAVFDDNWMQHYQPKTICFDLLNTFKPQTYDMTAFLLIRITSVLIGVVKFLEFVWEICQGNLWEFTGIHW